MRQRMKNMSIYTEELEKKSSENEQRMTEMQETIGMQLNEISREKRIRERAETEVQQLQEEIIVKKNELEVKYKRLFEIKRKVLTDNFWFIENKQVILAYKNALLETQEYNKHNPVNTICNNYIT